MNIYSAPLLRRAISSINENDETARLLASQGRMSEPGFWSSDDAREVMEEAKDAEDRLALRRRLADLELIEEAARDPELVDDAEAMLAELGEEAERSLLCCRHADTPSIITISAGAGGEDARDFTAMTARELIAYAEERGLTAEMTDQTWEGSGLRDLTLRVSGPGAFRIMRTEAGKRRLVRKSPFGAGGRQTSFCVVTCAPELPEREFRLDEADLRYETYRDTGPGGQHRNTTDSAVRITHVPTGISAKSAMRSQHENRRMALAALSARVAQHLREQDDAAAASLLSGGGPAGFGGHTRTLVLDPYRLVRNEVSGVSSADVDGYLAGGCADVRCGLPMAD